MVNWKEINWLGARLDRECNLWVLILNNRFYLLIFSASIFNLADVSKGGELKI